MRNKGISLIALVIIIAILIVTVALGIVIFSPKNNTTEKNIIKSKSYNEIANFLESFGKENGFDINYNAPHADDIKNQLVLQYGNYSSMEVSVIECESLDSAKEWYEYWSTYYFKTQKETNINDIILNGENYDTIEKIVLYKTAMNDGFYEKYIYIIRIDNSVMYVSTMDKEDYQIVLEQIKDFFSK